MKKQPQVNVMYLVGKKNFSVTKLILKSIYGFNFMDVWGNK